MNDEMAKQRKQELDLYRLCAKDDAFKITVFDTIRHLASMRQ